MGARRVLQLPVALHPEALVGARVGIRVGAGEVGGVDGGAGEVLELVLAVGVAVALVPRRVPGVHPFVPALFFARQKTRKQILKEIKNLCYWFSTFF